MKKRIISMLFAIVMVVGIMPNFGLTALAAETSDSVASVTVSGETTNYTDIEAAVEAATNNAGSMLTLLDDITADKHVTIESGSFTIDLNGKTWQRSTYLMYIRGDANVKIIDNSTEGTGKLLCTGSAYTIMLYGRANLEIAGGTVENDRAAEAIGMDLAGNPSESTLTVSGGTVKSQYDAISAFGSSITVTGGTLESGEADMYYHTGKIDLSGHSNPTGITICNGTGAEVTPGENTIKLPDGYVMLDKSNNPATVADTLTAGQTYTVGVVPVTHSVKVSAIDSASGNAIAGATMQLIDSTGYVAEEWVSTTEAYTVTGLVTGEVYTLQATVAPAGYVLPSDITFSIDESGNVSSAGTVSADGILLVEFAKTMVKVSAIETGAGEATEGAHMQILDAEGNPVDEWVSVVDDEATEDVDESIHMVYGLKIGEVYTLHATVAPDGYAIAPDTTFTIGNDGKVRTTGSLTGDGVLLVEFDITVVQFSAVDVANGNDFAGATMQILDKNGTLVEEWVSVADTETTEDVDESVYTVTGLNIEEEYTLHVTVAPEGYTIPADTTFNIDHFGKITTTGSLTEEGVLLVKFETSVTRYPLWVGSEQFTSEKLCITDDNGGTATYDPNTNTLTLNNYTYSGTGEGDTNDKAAIFYYGEETLTLHLVGKSSITYSDNTPGNNYGFYADRADVIFSGTGDLTSSGGDAEWASGGIYVYHDLTLSGTGKLNVIGKNGGAISYGIYCAGALTISAGTVNITTGEAQDSIGIRGTYGAISVDGGSLNITCGNASSINCGIYTVYGDFVCSDGTVTVTSGNASSYSYGIYTAYGDFVLSDGTVTVTGGICGTDEGGYSCGIVARNISVHDGHLTAVSSTAATSVGIYAFETAALYGGVLEAAGQTQALNLAPTVDSGFTNAAVWYGDNAETAIGAKPIGDLANNYDQKYVKVKSIPVYVEPSYCPTIEDSTGGSTAVSDKNPEQGDRVTIITKPDEGYEAGKVTVTDSRGSQVEVKDNGDGTYTYIQPVGSVTIRVIYKSIGCPGEAYSDLDTNAWYHEAVDYVLENGLMNGVGNGKFDPNGTTSRAMIVTILWRLEGEPVVNYLMQFEDIPAETWYTEAVRWAASEKIVEGWNGKFDPMGEITREQFATILWRYAKYKGYDVSVGEDTNILSYEDASSVSEYAIPAVQWACGAGLMQGDGVNLTPKADADRAQAAALFQRFCENVAEK